MKLKRNGRVLLILTLLASVLLTYEIYLTWQDNPLASIHKQRIYYTRDLSSPRNSWNLRKLLEDHEIRELPIRVFSDCTVEQMHQSLIGSDILCINESQLWSDVTRNGVKINQLSDLQAKTAIVSAVLEELKSRESRVREQVKQHFAEQMNRHVVGQDMAVHNMHINSDVDSVRLKRREIVEIKQIPSFHEHMVASFMKEAKNRPSDFAIPKLDSYYESHLPREKPAQDSNEDEDFDGLFPSNMKPIKRVKRPFVPVVVDSNHLNDFNGDWGNPFNNKWKQPDIPGIPPMPDRPPGLPRVESGDNLMPRLPDGPTVRTTHSRVSRIQSGVTSNVDHDHNIPKMPERPPSTPPTMPPKDHSARHSRAASLSEDLLRLKNYKFRENFDLVMRKLPTRFKYDGIRIKDRLKYIEKAVNATDVVLKDVVTISLNPDILERAKFQQQQMSEFCAEATDIDQKLPSSPEELNTLFQHLLYDDSRRMVFCYVPKNGCSNMKRMMLVLNGVLPPESSLERRPPEPVLKQVRSFRNLAKEEAIYKLKNYYKFAIVRNPLERLLSAYRNKLESPLNYAIRRNFPERLKAYILKKYRREDFEAWIADEGAHNTTDIHPSFSEFLQFMTRFPLDRYNEHFKPSLQLCFPCAVHYDLFLNFKMLEYDVFALMQFLDIPFQYYPESIAHKMAPTGNYLQEYFKDVDIELKVKLFHVFKNELEFYYTVYPEEWGMHRDL